MFRYSAANRYTTLQTGFEKYPICREIHNLWVGMIHAQPSMSELIRAEFIKRVVGFLSLAHSSHRRERRFRWSAPNGTASFFARKLEVALHSSLRDRRRLAVLRHRTARKQFDDVVRQAIVQKPLKGPGKLGALQIPFSERQTIFRREDAGHFGADT